jgi:hypothetical protein
MKRDTSGPNTPGRFVATIHPGRGVKDLASLAALGIDVMPVRDSEVHALVSVGECVALLEAGYEVRLLEHYPVEPIDPALIASDREAKRWLKGRLAEIRPDVRQGKPSRRSGR